MNSRISHSLARQLLLRSRASSPFTTYSLSPTILEAPSHRNLSVQSFIPRVLSPSWWSKQLPEKLFRSDSRSKNVTVRRKWNPAWGFVLLALFVGSQSINIIALKQENEVFHRQTDARIRTLKEVIGKIQSGKWKPDSEEVQKALRLGKENRNDRGWDEVMEQIEKEDEAWQKEAQAQRERIEKEEAERVKFASLESPTAWSPEMASTAVSQKPKKKITADDYYT